VSPPLRKLDLAATDLDVDWNHAPILSPDGTRFAYLSKSRIWIRDLKALMSRAVADVSSSTPIAWSPDSRSLVFAETRKLWQVSVEGGKPTALFEMPGTGNIIGATWSRSTVIASPPARGLYKCLRVGDRALSISIPP
jgi:hypothetical protein